jgi:NRPS condensation-like uncharacterized protein
MYHVKDTDIPIEIYMEMWIIIHITQTVFDNPPLKVAPIFRYVFNEDFEIRTYKLIFHYSVGYISVLICHYSLYLNGKFGQRESNFGN